MNICSDITLFYINSVADMTELYNNYSKDMPNRTYYRFVAQHNIGEGFLTGGCWYVEGFKNDNNYEWQMAKLYVQLARHPIQYRVKNVNWLSWENVV